MDRPDINGRIESFDQSLRSLDRRLRAIERRLSGNTTESNLVLLEPESGQWTDIDIEELNGEMSTLQALLDKMRLELDTLKSNDLSQVNKSLSEIMHDIQAINEKIEALTKQQTNLRDQTATSVDSLSCDHKSEITDLGKELEKVNLRLKRQENINKITIGSIKVPVELSGVVASVALIITGYLVWADQWEIIRSTYYPIGLAVLFAAAVIIKFVMSNRQPEKA
ncbi:MAG: hypothetical protein MIO93_14875 [ANME-2 cluster archaeon]|jgi:chromosome segregation ATPase|nr:hypothetical protein [ANME-2 cluster archaeon]